MTTTTTIASPDKQTSPADTSETANSGAKAYAVAPPTPGGAVPLDAM